MLGAATAEASPQSSILPKRFHANARRDFSNTLISFFVVLKPFSIDILWFLCRRIKIIEFHTETIWIEIGNQNLNCTTVTTMAKIMIFYPFFLLELPTALCRRIKIVEFNRETIGIEIGIENRNLNCTTFGVQNNHFRNVASFRQSVPSFDHCDGLWRWDNKRLRWITTRWMCASRRTTSGMVGQQSKIDDMILFKILSAGGHPRSSYFQPNRLGETTDWPDYVEILAVSK